MTATSLRRQAQARQGAHGKKGNDATSNQQGDQAHGPEAAVEVGHGVLPLHQAVHEQGMAKTQSQHGQGDTVIALVASDQNHAGQLSGGNNEKQGIQYQGRDQAVGKQQAETSQNPDQTQGAQRR